MNPSFEHQTLRVYQQMALSSFDLLGPVVAALLAAHACCLDRLAVNYRCTGLRVPLEAHPNALAQGRVHPFPGAIYAPSPEVTVDGLPGREVVRQQAPGTAAMHDVEDGVDDLAEGVHPGSPGSFGGREMGALCKTTRHRRGRSLVCSSHAR